MAHYLPHRITHTTKMNVPRFKPSQTDWYLIHQPAEEWKAESVLVLVIYLHYSIPQ